MPDVFVARQPIFNRDLEVVGYELLFRSQEAQPIPSPEGATASVVLNAFTEIGLGRIVGDRTAWINVSRDSSSMGWHRRCRATGSGWSCSRIRCWTSSSIPFPGDMCEALIAHAGKKGLLLKCVQALEAGDFGHAHHLVPGAGEAYLDALAWANEAANPVLGNSAAPPVMA